MRERSQRYRSAVEVARRHCLDERQTTTGFVGVQELRMFRTTFGRRNTFSLYKPNTTPSFPLPPQPSRFALLLSSGFPEVPEPRCPNSENQNRVGLCQSRPLCRIPMINMS